MNRIRCHFILLFGLLLAPVLRAAEVEDSAPNPLDPVVVPESLQENLRLPTNDRKIPFKESEVLSYKLGWSMFRVANATLKTLPSEDLADPTLKMELRTKTKGFINAIYKVDNYSWSWVDPAITKSFGYEIDQDEGGRERKKKTVIDWNEKLVQFDNLLNDEEFDPVRVMEGTFDPLSIVLYVRTLDFEVGDELVVPTTNGREFFFTIIHVTEKVTRKFLIGEREAYVLEPEIKDLGGVFKKSDDGKIVFYFSTDEHKFPLRLESEVSVGSFWAELTHAVVDGQDVD